MNYYERHLGDYARDTGHLSLIEHGAYTKLLDRYYVTEAGIPEAEIYKITGARTQSEKKAVVCVLREFFKLEHGIWVKGRVEEEINRYQDKQNKAKQSANARWKNKPTHSAGNANAYPNAIRTHSAGNALQTPDTSNQTPALKTKAAAAASPAREGKVIHRLPEEHAAAADDEIQKPQPNGADPIAHRAIELATLLRKRGAALTGSDPFCRRWAAAGITDAQAITALETALQRRADAGSAQPVNSAYIDSILNDTKITATPWWTSIELMAAKAKEIGIKPPMPGESREQFRNRINEKLGERVEAPP